MNLHNLYYKDIRDNPDSMRVQYDKYYELHKMKHSSCSTSRLAFAQRIRWYWRSVGKAIQVTWKPKTMMWYWRGYKWEKCNYFTMTDRIKKGMKISEAIKPLPHYHYRNWSRSDRHHAPEPKCKLRTYYTRIHRWYTHEQAIVPHRLKKKYNVMK